MGLPLRSGAMRASTTLRASLAVAAAIVVMVAGCGGDDGDKGTARDVRANGTDAAFVNAMIPHHEAAVDAADLALSRAEHRRLESLAEGIVQFQSAELATLRTVRDVVKEAGVEEGDLGLSRSEQGMDHDAAALRDVANFDCAFLEMMIPHHEGAIRMARAELASGIHAELRRMSETIIDSQGSEIRLMKRFQRQWCGSSTGEHPSGTGEHGG
jgi:uncharacterized protein (DUF305 family)